nr:beta-propeller domain-containing protein [Acidobacteriota bacterium]
RLFTLKIGDGALKPISIRDAFGPDINPSNTWYDEMLVSDDTIVVIGYSYERGGTEIGLFNIDDAGKLTYRSTYHLRSNDYYSSRNYASRLIEGKLIFYTPLYLSSGAEDAFQSFPAVRKWHKRAANNEFRRIISATRVYRPEGDIDSGNGLALHTVTVCDLARGDFKCEATGVIGPPGRVFYVSPESVYVWASNWNYIDGRARSSSILYRMPLNGSSPSALQVSGSPVDQFSFLESEDGQLNVLVRSDAAGDGMWGAEVAAGDVALMRVSLTSFSDGSEAVPASNYRKLSNVQGYTFQNRFVGDYLLYGTGSGWGDPQNSKGSTLYAVHWAGGELSEIVLPHGVDRIEAMGSDAVVVGTDGSNLHFTSVRLDESPEIAGTYTRKGASQGELRSHGFFYKAEGPNSGTLGLPISVPGRAGYRHLFESSAAILFLRNESLHFEEVGELTARGDKAVDDACRASCVDWYGNARPLFIRGRLLALLGYEIVEGSLDGGRVRESRRVNYAPRQVEITRR